MISDDAQDFVRDLSAQLPPVIARGEVGRLLGGMVSPKTLKNADCNGTGPAVAYRVGRGVVYKTDALLDWIVQRFGVTRIRDVNHP